MPAPRESALKTHPAIVPQPPPHWRSCPSFRCSTNPSRPNETAARVDETAARAGETADRGNETPAQISETAAQSSETAALGSETPAPTSETAGRRNETPPRLNETAAGASETAGRTSETPALSKIKSKTPGAAISEQDTGTENSAPSASLRLCVKKTAAPPVCPAASAPSFFVLASRRPARQGARHSPERL